MDLLLNFFSFHFVSLKEQIIFKTDLSRALSQGRLSPWGHGASGRLKCTVAPGISTLGPLHGQVRLCLQT